jgi:hypothetical protein
MLGFRVGVEVFGKRLMVKRGGKGGEVEGWRVEDVEKVWR